MVIASVDDYRIGCKDRLPRFLYDYINGGSYQENTLRANIADLQATLLRQRVMVDESHLNLSISLWDQNLSLPVILGPVGMAGMYSSRGEVKAANAAKAAGIPFTLSTMGVCDIHEVTQKSGVPPWFQLYMLKDRSFVKSVIERSVSAKSQVLVFTVDLATPGRRYSEVHDGMEKDPTIVGLLGFVAQGAAHPRWALDIVTKGRPLKFGTVAGAMPKGVPYGKFVHDNFDASTTWKDIEWIRSIFPGKIILKGILDPEDAKRAVQTDIDGILVSNHGGRQLDSVTSTVRALPKIVDAVQGKVPVFMDGGIRSGLDVLKALALGAKACFVGRAWAYALGAAGERGVRNMLDILAEELRVGMILTGCSDVTRATSDLLLKD
ncbi:MAG TPA: L-lactate dehydrogenase [Xanthobacteraceae bacterium]|jgi:L-lactate dehydrogenase (cytochrome)